MATESINMRDYGRLENQVEQLAKDVHDLKLTVEAMSTMMQQAQGGWKAIMLVGGIAGALGAVVAWIATHVRI